ncbi:hypothetical protein M1K46_24255 [Fictibacillus sp. WQ 8-8]|uniref:hypothetical protein n=1 Tax=Fictibacillus sp. WQ 8-8 TaxID=2938788 RepID=UPI00210D4E12|nr:hypothetical protein [Fictibacillus sp. WQ 8-8]MCQ6268690.1 hypothetical protein [Fictibacillus sp. WQ 8-8]
MRIKTIFSSAFIASALLLPTNSASAASGWNYVGTSTFHKTSVSIESTGGDFKACLAPGWAWKGYVALYERDPDGINERVDSIFDFGKWLDPQQCAVRC